MLVAGAARASAAREREGERRRTWGETRAGQKVREKGGCLLFAAARGDADAAARRARGRFGRELLRMRVRSERERGGGRHRAEERRGGWDLPTPACKSYSSSLIACRTCSVRRRQCVAWRRSYHVPTAGRQRLKGGSWTADAAAGVAAAGATCPWQTAYISKADSLVYRTSLRRAVILRHVGMPYSMPAYRSRTCVVRYRTARYNKARCHRHLSFAALRRLP